MSSCSEASGDESDCLSHPQRIHPPYVPDCRCLSLREQGVSNSGPTLLGIFPRLDSLGGVQRSGRVAWDGLVRDPGLGDARSFLFTYGRGNGGAGAPVPQNGAALHTGSKVAAVLAAVRSRLQPKLVVVWHLSLLKLLPFFWIRHARVVLFLHGIEAWRPHDRLTRWQLDRVDQFLSNSDYTWAQFLAFHPHLGGAPHQTVHLGLLSPLTASPPGPGEPPAVLMLSRLLRSEDYKGHREMITAWPHVLRRIPTAELWIAGDGDLGPMLQDFASRCGVTDRVRFLGHVSEGQKHALLARCRCLAMMSHREGFGLVYLEAMRMGRPCLVSTVDAGREVVNPPEAGLAADPRDVEQVAAAVCRLLSPGPQWTQWSIHARLRYERLFTARHFQQRLVAALSAPSGGQHDHPCVPS